MGLDQETIKNLFIQFKGDSNKGILCFKSSKIIQISPYNLYDHFNYRVICIITFDVPLTNYKSDF